MERAERFVFLGIALAFDILVPVLWVMLVLTAFTAVHRFVHVYRQAAHPPRSTPPRARLLPRDERRRSAPPDAAALVVDGPPGRRPATATRRRHPSARRNSRP